jgi:hypothetical protein
MKDNRSALQSAAQRLVGNSDTPTEQTEPLEPEQEVLETEAVLEEETEEVTPEENETEPTVDDTEEEVSDEVEETPADETTETEATDDEPFYTVKVDGDEYEVNLEELTKGYQLEKNYTKKTQALQEERTAMTAAQATVETERGKYLQLIEMAAQSQAQGIMQARDKLSQIDRQTDPIGFMQAQIDVQEMEGHLQGQVQQYQQAVQERDNHIAAERTQKVADARVILAEQIPDFDQTAVTNYARSVGYVDAELANVIDARDIVVLNKARLYDELVANKGTVNAKKKAVVRPKVKSPAPKSKGMVKARQVKEQRGKLRSSGSLKDAAALISQRMT